MLDLLLKIYYNRSKETKEGEMLTTTEMTTKEVKVKAPSLKPKNLLDLTVEELKECLEKGKLPDDITWEGVEDHPLFPDLFRKRHDANALIKLLAKAKGISLKPKTEVAPRPKLPTQIQYQGVVPLELRRQKLQLKQKELELKEQKQTLQTEMYHRICDIQGDVIKVLTTLVKLIKVLKKEEK